MSPAVRSILGFLVLVAVLLALGIGVLLPAVVAPIVASQVRASSPFGDQPIDVDVDVDPLGLLSGRIREIRVRGTNLESNGARIGTVDVTAEDVGIFDRAFHGLDGRLEDLDMALADGTVVRIGTVTLTGPSTDVTAIAQLSPTDAVKLIRASLGKADVVVDSVELVDGGVALTVLGQRAAIGLSVEDGRIVIHPPFTNVTVPIMESAPGDPWRFTSVQANPNGLGIRASVDVSRVLGD